VILVRPKSEANQGSRIRHGFRLPSMIGLIAPHGVFTGLIPGSRRFAFEIMLADQCLLNRARALRIDLLLTARDGSPFSFALGSDRLL
jgi:hypothetical protein